LEKLFLIVPDQTTTFINALFFLWIMADKIICTTTKIDIANDSGNVKFPCPKCGEYEIVRSRKAREIVARYKCPNCGFEGPN